MIVSPHTASAEAGARVLRRGGNAIEAVIAAGAALSVTYPHFCGLGGDAIWIVSDEAGASEVFIGIGQAAQDIPQFGDGIPLRGPLSTLTAACLVDSWDCVINYSATHWQGRETLSDLLEHAIVLADEGFDVSHSQAFWHDFRKNEVSGWHGFASTFRSAGLQRQPALARTLQTIAENGARDFYEGALAHRIAAGLKEAGSPLTAADLAAVRTRCEKPWRLDYNGRTLLAPPPPAQGVTTLQIMGILQYLEMARFDPGSADFYHHLVEAVKQAFVDRGSIADPDFATIPLEWLSDDCLRAKSQNIRPDHALVWPQPFRHGDTAFIGAVDDKGRAVSMLQSIYFDWGSGVVVGDTGILWQNRGAAFSLDPKSPNVLQPGKRPFYTLNPGMALKAGRPDMVYGTQGADGQPQTLSLLLSLLIDHDLSPHDALSHPRFLLGKTFSDTNDSLKVEAGGSKTLEAELAARGHVVSMIDQLSPLGGQAGVIRRQPGGSWVGAHDPRSDGGAIGIS
ncbi:gamma-glutamyltransferase family protein [Rhizobium sp. L1K21]|uniref:gamma-glutamyltransferase family protein n=1 Tax=Rhizobium sp. L1K21 TaxID=2954933 RepID=UPI002093930B|nr:gamma-glutamyltransferase family protein [Rhizobium sp. L1K21]MCO6188650.1 gamma-glutamyltransferase family protein [Rhizobium sp. L1K21]